MSEITKIEWCDSTFNPWLGCTKISPACDDCYAARSTPARTMGVAWGAKQPRHRTSPATWAFPARWERDHAAFFAQHGRRRRVFCASLADVFDNEVPTEWRKDLFELIRVTSHLDWLLLTKRPQNIVRMVRSHGAIAGNGTRYLPDNVWLGTTAEDQKRAEMNLPALIRTRRELGARLLFVSVEPMLSAVDLTRLVVHTGAMPPGAAGPGSWDVIDFDRLCVTLNALQPDAVTGERRLDWVICGGESGPKARPMHPDWARRLRDQCAAASVPFLFKQWGEFLPADADECDPGIEDSRLFWSDGSKWDRFDGQRTGVDLMARLGKKAAGRLLDGVEHNGYPEVTP